MFVHALLNILVAELISFWSVVQMQIELRIDKNVDSMVHFKYTQLLVIKL